MLTLLLIAGSLVAAPQSRMGVARVSPACSLLSVQEVASLIGQARPMTLTNGPAGSSCMFQNGNKTLSVLFVTLSSSVAATGQWDAKKRASSGQDLTGWPIPAYSSALETQREQAGIVGVVKARTFVEVRIVDATQKAPDLKAKLEAVMQPVAGRLK